MKKASDALTSSFFANGKFVGMRSRRSDSTVSLAGSLYPNVLSDIKISISSLNAAT
jgi:hypothetical protein